MFSIHLLLRLPVRNLIIVQEELDAPLDAFPQCHYEDIRPTVPQYLGSGLALGLGLGARARVRGKLSRDAHSAHTLRTTLTHLHPANVDTLACRVVELAIVDHHGLVTIPKRQSVNQSVSQPMSQSVSQPVS